MELAITVEVLDLAALPARVSTGNAAPAGRAAPDEPSSGVGFSVTDLVFLVLFAVGIGAVVWNVQRSMDARFFIAPAGNDVWFEADLPTVADNVLHRWSAQSRNARHPLFPLLATGTAYAFRAGGLGDRAILALLSALAGAAWVAVFYVTARALTGRRLDAVVFTLLACSTSSAMFFLTVPETYALGSFTLLVPLALCVADRQRRRSEAWYVAASAVSMSVTSTNWMSGMATAAVKWPWRRALQITVNAVCCVGAVWAVQRTIFPTAPFFFGYSNESRFVLPAASGGPGPVSRVLFFHSIVMPHIDVIAEPKWGLVMSVQHSALASAGAWGAVATALWMVLLAITLFGLLTSRRDPPVRIALGATIAGQVALHLLYGEETFLYSLHVAPLLILAAAFAAASSRQRRGVLVLAAALALIAAVNNASQLASAMAFFARST